ncbi:hypothetical protein [Solicola sp. PLA-1-18]|uniref:hypothetical protein n=1 Tax=Solicola sp. PLA-1-18 TaxID=3380532 RepID=UPI003B825E52
MSEFDSIVRTSTATSRLVDGLAAMRAEHGGLGAFAQTLRGVAAMDGQDALTVELWEAVADLADAVDADCARPVIARPD